MLGAFPAVAEIEKRAIVCDNGICFSWWPKLPELKGWYSDQEASESYSMHTLVPYGENFADAETVIYANAPYKPRMPKVTTVETLIEDDQKDFRQNVPGIAIKEIEPVVTADGQRLRSFLFMPPTGSSESWERVSYGEEGDFYLIFTLSSRTKDSMNHRLDDYLSLIRAYRSTW
jgi:hypothetical protein